MSEGDEAPDFELHDQDGNLVKLSDHGGKPVVLYFYPRADTPGCTAQACGIRDRDAEYAAAGAKVLGVSPDEPPALRKFADKHDLAFTLLADPDHSVAEAYGVWVEKSMYGKEVHGHPARHLHRRRRRQDRQGLPEGLAEDPRRRRVGGARRAERVGVEARLGGT